MDRLPLPPLAPAPFTGRFVRIAVAFVSATAWVWSGTAHAADFSCAGGDVQCLIDAITASNQNQEANTIRLAAGTYSLLSVNNLDSPRAQISQFENGVFVPAFAGSGLPVIVGDVTIIGVAADATII